MIFFSAREKRGREFHTNIRSRYLIYDSRWKKRKRSVAEDDVTHRLPLVRRFKFDMKKIKIKLTWLCVLLSRDAGGVECLSISLAIVQVKRSERLNGRVEKKRLVIRLRLRLILRLPFYLWWKVERSEKRRQARAFMIKSDELPSIDLKNSLKDDGCLLQPLAKSFLIFFLLSLHLFLSTSCGKMMGDERASFFFLSFFICMLTKSSLVKK